MDGKPIAHLQYTGHSFGEWHEVMQAAEELRLDGFPFVEVYPIEVPFDSENGQWFRVDVEYGKGTFIVEPGDLIVWYQSTDGTRMTIQFHATPNNDKNRTHTIYQGWGKAKPQTIQVKESGVL